MKRNILVTKHEIQSGLNRQRFAELLILQLPKDHDGRNTWLLNYGVSEEAEKLREVTGSTWNDFYMAANE